ncbi:hypothetical protein BV898_05332 [Hypsibius exemplaris]|uniref:G-protein coupled receptors family 1 profile domain-containing protein n=1 Tax=Hypsibius exemplaris TaxID=2072580 RepID=A0A1W0WZW2_HYPEX|nr:hypothetical protein BV898_05332 [Hypsibius exemplaris]
MTSTFANLSAVTVAKNDTTKALAEARFIREINIIAGYSYAIIGLSGCVGSVLCLVAIFTLRSRSHHNTLSSIQPIFVSLCISSLIFSIVCAFQAFSTLASRPNFLAEPRYDAACQVLSFAYMAILAVDQLQHAALAFHRFFSIVVGQRVAWFHTRACTATLVALPWVIAGAVCSLPFVHVGYQYGYNITLDRCFLVSVYYWPYITFYKTFFISCSLISIAVCYTAIAVKVGVAHRRAMGGAVEPSTHSVPAVVVVIRPSHPQSRPVKDRAVATRGGGVTKTVFALCLLFLVSFLPWMIYPMVAHTDVALTSPSGITVVTLFLLGCAASPWLIVLLTPALRGHIAESFCRIAKAVDSQNKTVISVTVPETGKAYFTSPNYPQNYPKGTLVEYNVLTSKGNLFYVGLLFDVVDFELDSGSFYGQVFCEDDFVNITEVVTAKGRSSSTKDDDTPKNRKLCGPQTSPLRIATKSNSAIVRFQTGFAGPSFKGFNMSVEALIRPNNTVKVPASGKVFITSDNYPVADYFPNQGSVYYVKGPEGTQIEFDTIDFKVDGLGGFGELRDYVHLSEGSGNKSIAARVLLGGRSYYGTEGPKKLRSTKSEVILYFKSGLINTKPCGFNISAEVVH